MIANFRVKLDPGTGNPDLPLLEPREGDETPSIFWRDAAGWHGGYCLPEGVCDGQESVLVRVNAPKRLLDWARARPERFREAAPVAGME